MKEKYDVLRSFGDSTNPRFDSYYKNKIFTTTFKKDLKASLEILAKKVIKAVKEEDICVIILDDRKVLKIIKLSQWRWQLDI